MRGETLLTEPIDFHKQSSQENELLKDAAKEVQDLAFQNQVIMAEGGCSQEPVQLPRDLPQDQSCQNMLRNSAYIRDHMNRVDKVALKLEKCHILSEEEFLAVHTVYVTRGPSHAAEDILEILYRDPDERNHTSFIRILEETGQMALAAHLRQQMHIENDNLHRLSGTSNTAEGTSRFADINQLSENVIIREIKKRISTTEVAMDFSSQTLARCLLTIPLDSLLSDLQQKLIISHDEHQKLKALMFPHERVDMLISFLRKKDKETIEDFIKSLQNNPQTVDLATFLCYVIKKCEQARKTLPVKKEENQTEKISLKIGINANKSMPWGDITVQVEKNKQCFLDNNLGTPGEIIYAEQKCLQLTILLENLWDVNNLMKNITCGLFTQRLRCWLRNKGFDISPDTEFETTLSIVTSNNGKIEKGEAIAVQKEMNQQSHQEIAYRDMFSDKSTQTKSDTFNKETQSDITVSEVNKEQLIVKPFVSKEEPLEKQRRRLRLEEFDVTGPMQYIHVGDYGKYSPYIKEAWRPGKLKEDTLWDSPPLHSITYERSQISKQRRRLTELEVRGQMKNLHLGDRVNFCQYSKEAVRPGKKETLKMEENVPQKTHQKMTFKDLTDEKDTPVETHKFSVSGAVDAHYHRTKEVMIGDHVTRLKQYGSELWCIGNKTLYVYSLDCKLLRSVKLQTKPWCRSLAKTDTDSILVATLGEGVLLLNEQGMKISTVADGRFIDICACNGKVFALEKVSGSVYVLAKLRDGDDWREEDTIKLMGFSKYFRGMHSVTVDTHIYVTSCTSKDVQVLVYDHNGIQQRQYDISALVQVPKTHVRLCGLDTQGNVLLAVNNRLYQWNKFTELREITLSECKRSIIDAVIDSKRENIWAIENPGVLAKYARKVDIVD